MLEIITSVPAVAGVALTTAALFIRDMLEGEQVRPSGRMPQRAPHGSDIGGLRAGRVRYRVYGLVCSMILLALVVLRFVTLAG